jgi:hypothetical protein
VHQIDRGAGRGRKVRGLTHSFDFGFDRPACGKVLDAGATGRVELGGARGDDRVILSVDRDDRARLRGGP